MKSNINEMILPNTKKTVFYRVKSELIDKNFTGIATLLGPRRVGKTTLLQQL
jgi:predicted AAA+ superfamily ATPase